MLSSFYNVIWSRGSSKLIRFDSNHVTFEGQLRCTKKNITEPALITNYAYVVLKTLYFNTPFSPVRYGLMAPVLPGYICLACTLEKPITCKIGVFFLANPWQTPDPYKNASFARTFRFYYILLHIYHIHKPQGI